jgi:ribosomal protein S11
MSLNFKINSFLKTICVKKRLGGRNSSKQKTLLHNEKIRLKGYFVKFIIYISSTKSNTFVHVMDCLGSERYFYSIKSISQSTKLKKKNSDIQVTEQFYKILVAKLKFLQGTPIALHLNSVEFNFQWFLDKITKKLFITIVRFYTKYSHNGCRKKKIKRKKVKKILI